MKKMILAITAALMMSVTMTAQETTTEEKPEMKRPDMTEMVKQRTDETVKRYGLNEEQAALLLELNTKHADKMMPGRRGPRPDGRRGMGREMRQPGQRPDFQRNDSLAREGRPNMRGNREQMQKEMEEYDAEVKKIMTEEQYNAYKADREKMMRERPQRRQANPEN